MSPLPLFFKGLTPELVRKAEVELNETPHVKAKAMVEFRRLINEVRRTVWVMGSFSVSSLATHECGPLSMKNPSGRDYVVDTKYVTEQQDLYSRLEDEFLLRFLRVKKFNTQKAMKVLRNYYNFQRRHSGVFTRLKPSQLRNVIEMNCAYCSPYRLEDGSHVAILRLGEYNPRVATGEQLMANIFIVSELMIECEASQIGGGNLVIDLRNTTFQQYKMFITLAFMKFLLNALQECWPERLRGIHVVNEPYAMHAVFQVIKRIGKKKLMNRIHFHGKNVSDIYEHIPREYLPEELGGTLGPMNNKDLVSYIYTQESFFERMHKYGILE